MLSLVIRCIQHVLQEDRTSLEGGFTAKEKVVLRGILTRMEAFLR